MNKAKFKQIRNHARLSQVELASILGVCEKTLRNYESEATGIPLTTGYVMARIGNDPVKELNEIKEYARIDG